MNDLQNDLNNIRTGIHVLGSMYLPNQAEEVGSTRLEAIRQQAEEIISNCYKIESSYDAEGHITVPEPEILYYSDGSLELISYGRIPPVPDPSSMKYDYSELRKMLNDSVTKFCRDNNIPKYTAFVHITFTQYYGEEENRMLDCDNMYIKPFIDAISRNLLPDDGPEYCDVKIQGKRGDSTYLDVLVERAE